MNSQFDVEVYTDGACSGNPGPGAWACLCFDHKAQLAFEMAGSFDRSTTNNQMELQAVIEALAALKKSHQKSDELSIRVISDSKYVLDGIQKWIINWKKKGWKTAAGKDVLNQDFWKKLDSLATSLRIKWDYTPGHSSCPYNNRVDELAVAYSKQNQLSLFRGSLLEYRNLR